MSVKLEPLEIGPGQANWLREMARDFDAITPPGERYRAPDFVEWLVLEQHSRGPQLRGDQREHLRAAGRRRWQERSKPA